MFLAFVLEKSARGCSEVRANLPYPCSVMVDDPVTVRFFAGARAAAGCDQVTVAPAGLQEVIQGLHAAFPALRTVTPVCSFLVDGVSAKPHEDGPFICAGSRVEVLPPFAGG
jgi:molybdopterin converting factor small subunit